MWVELEDIGHGGMCWEEAMGNHQRWGSCCCPGHSGSGIISNKKVQFMKNPQGTMCGKESKTLLIKIKQNR